MSVLVDTSVWSLALRRDRCPSPEVEWLRGALVRGDLIFSTGLILQELLQGFLGPKDSKRIIRDFRLLPMLVPEIEDHVHAAQLRNKCRRSGLQIGTIDALLAQLCLRHQLTLLTTDRDFDYVSKQVPLPLMML